MESRVMGHASLSVKGRRRLVPRVLGLDTASPACLLTPPRRRTWPGPTFTNRIRRYQVEGEPGLVD